MKRSIGILLLILILSGCVLPSSSTGSTTSATNTTTTTTMTTIPVLYPSPENIHFVGSTMVWDAIPQVSGYELMINDSLYTTYEASFSLAEIDYGSLEISIVAFGANAERSLPTTIEIDYVPHLEAPQGVRILDGVLYWDETANASHYIVVIDAVTYDVLGEGTNPPTDLSYSLSSLSANEYHSIYVLAAFANWLSEPSATVSYDGTFEFSGSFALEYSLESLEDLTLEFENKSMLLYKIEGEHFYEGGILGMGYDAGILCFHRDYLEELSYGEFVFTLATSDGIYEIQLTIKDTREPFLVSSSQIYVVLGNDVVLDFELYDGEFLDLSGNDITVADYTFEGSQLTISGDYIQYIFNRDPDRTVLILGYTLSANEDITIGYLFIRIQTE